MEESPGRRDVKFQMLLAPSEVAAIDEVRWKHRLPSRAEAMRILIAKGIEAEAKQGEAA